MELAEQLSDDELAARISTLRVWYKVFEEERNEVARRATEVALHAAQEQRVRRRVMRMAKGAA